MKSSRCRQSVVTESAGRERWYGTSNKKRCGNENRNEWLVTKGEETKRLGDIRLLYRHFEQSEKSLSFAVRSHASHTCAAHFSVFLICLSYRHCPIRLTSLAAFPLRGRLYVGDSNALVYDALETIFSLSFIPLVPYPARFARHLPHAGKALCREYRHPHPTSAPSGHLLPREGASTRAPSLGRGCRA